MRADENEARGNWRGRLDYVLVTFSYVIGFSKMGIHPYNTVMGGGGRHFWI